ncbi:MAG: ABC transporter ATP-binding protein, partial [Lachnospiraceae bacterium]|nr:ABC transporter ATP-binding protein [Lachnospiraceae bacterium]
IVEVRDTILKLQEERNMTILISSHILEELSKLCTDYGMIHNGVLLQELTREELMKRCCERMELTLEHTELALPVLDQMGFTDYQVVDYRHIHIFERIDESAAVNQAIVTAGIPLEGITTNSEALESYFLNLTGGVDNA